ncbi:MAG TPA: glucosamine-6-phosphate deaminase [Mucilaginibacter sp.]|jgi:glucosamine-6-phosphate deaminase
MEKQHICRDVPIYQGITTRHIDNLTICVYESRLLIGEDAADKVCIRINSLLEQQELVNIIFAAAPSQNEFLAALSQKTTIDWKRVNAFHMDEYIKLPENDPRTFASFLNKKIFGRQHFHSVNYINGNAADIGAECRRYTKLLAENPPDIVCLGIGENGHLAFNDPHVADFNDPLMVKMVKLDAACRQQQVNDGCFTNLTDVPAYAVTLTIPALMAGKHIYCVVPDDKKAEAVYNTVYGEIIEKYPSAILRKHANAILFLDKNSSSLL